jgi:hypothetical protein
MLYKETCERSLAPRLAAFNVQKQCENNVDPQNIFELPFVPFRANPHSTQAGSACYHPIRMANLEDIKQRLSHIFSDAQTQGYKIGDIMSSELQEHLSQKKELDAAHEEHRQMKSREKTLQAANDALQTLLREKEDELDNQPENFKAFKVDLKQAQRQIDYYKGLAEDSQRRADRYQQILTQATKDQLVISEVVAKNKQLQHELVRYELTIRKLQEDNERAAENFARMRDEDKKAMAANDTKLAEMLSHASQIETESEAFSDVFSNLIDTLEIENVTAASLLNDKGALLRKMELLYNVVVSEVTPLKRFFSRAFDVLRVYQKLFQTLSDPYATSIGSLPRDLDALMKGAGEDLHAYHEIHKILSGVGGVTEDQVRTELNGMSKTADGMLTSFCFIKRDVENFLARLRTEPGTWLAMKAKFGGIWW